MDDRGGLGREVEGVAAEPQAGLAVDDGHAAPGQSDDPGERLAEHQDQQAVQPRRRRQVAGEQPVDLVEPFAFAHDRPIVVLEPRLIDPGEVLFSGPAEEPCGVVAGAGSAGVPGVHISLGGGLQLLAAACQPVEEVDRDRGGLLGVEERTGGNRFTFRPVTELPQEMPASERVDVATRTRIGDPVELGRSQLSNAAKVTVDRRP